MSAIALNPLVRGVALFTDANSTRTLMTGCSPRTAPEHHETDRMVSLLMHSWV